MENKVKSLKEENRELRKHNSKILRYLEVLERKMNEEVIKKSNPVRMSD